MLQGYCNRYSLVKKINNATMSLNRKGVTTNLFKGEKREKKATELSGGKTKKGPKMQFRGQTIK